MTGSPVVELNRAVAVAMADGPEAGLRRRRRRGRPARRATSTCTRPGPTCSAASAGATSPRSPTRARSSSRTVADRARLPRTPARRGHDRLTGDRSGQSAAQPSCTTAPAGWSSVGVVGTRSSCPSVVAVGSRASSVASVRSWSRLGGRRGRFLRSAASSAAFFAALRSAVLGGVGAVRARRRQALESRRRGDRVGQRAEQLARLRLADLGEPPELVELGVGELLGVAELLDRLVDDRR